jgi:Helix-turn-helix domain
MKKTSRNLEVDPGEPIMLRRAAMQNLLAPARCFTEFIQSNAPELSFIIKGWQVPKVEAGRSLPVDTLPRSEELADRLKVSRSWYSHIETGREVPNLKRLQQIARALGVTVEV